MCLLDHRHIVSTVTYRQRDFVELLANHPNNICLLRGQQPAANDRLTMQ